MMGRKMTLWLSKSEIDSLIIYYNENHDEIRATGHRNFDDWIGNMAYAYFTQVETKKRTD